MAAMKAMKQAMKKKAPPPPLKKKAMKTKQKAMKTKKNAMKMPMKATKADFATFKNLVRAGDWGGLYKTYGAIVLKLEPSIEFIQNGVVCAIDW